MLDFAITQAKERITLFVEVILPLAIAKNYTYRVPYELNDEITVGKRVVVQFGRSKIYTAIIASITQSAPEKYEAKYLIDVLDKKSIVNPDQMRFWQWMADYYMCQVGEVMNAALPAALKLASETLITMNRDWEVDKSVLNDKEFLIVEALSLQHELAVSEVSKLLGQKTVMPILKALFEKNIIHLSEEVNQRYKPRIKTLIYLNPIYQDQERLRDLFSILERAPKQLDALLALISMTRQGKRLAKSEIIEAAGVKPAAIKALIDKGIFLIEEKIISRLGTDDPEEISASFDLSEKQDQALEDIQSGFQSKDVVLLHGVTSSGKTQIYIRLMEEIIASGKQVLYLLPEIALTTHIIERLRQYFGGIIGVYHSKFNENERVEVWQKVLSGDFRIILGARSAVFLPFKNLGLIIVDEEHETSYKQFDPAPRYNARDTAIFLAGLYQAKVLLGSATPSLESYYNAKTDKYGLVELHERYGGVELPLTEVVSLIEEIKNKTIQTHFTSVLMHHMHAALEKKEQVILFQNRRGYAPVLMCKTCAYTSKCINCDVSLTFHKSSGKLHCHYCGYREEALSACPACGSTHLEHKGFGTEKIEEDLKLLLTDARISRMDLDTTRSKTAFQHILNDLEEKKIDILVGTQMVAKGLDFADVTVIGIINADSLLKYPDFRSNERSFQMLAQVSGRAGRRKKQGKVIIQTYDKSHRVINQVISNDYTGMYEMEIEERKKFKYPPFYRIIQLDVKNKDPEKLHHQAEYLGTELKKQFGDRVIGPEFPLINRIRNYYIKSVLLKVEKDGISITKVKAALRNILEGYETSPNSKGSIIQIDVDPY
jgi:primosomal protein N' (replication factor Y)